MIFQYPQPDRYPCNIAGLAARISCLRHFQYPQPDRYPCNLIIGWTPLSIIRTFSILNRIDIPATQTEASLHVIVHVAFSILNRIDIPATATLSGEGSTLFSHFWPYRRFFWPLSASFLQRIRCLLYHSATSSKTVFCPEMGGIFEYT